MQQVVTTGIVLGRLNYGEADKIITVITPDQGKLRLMAKGVRRIRSKLAGGIELFSVSTITYIPGKKDISTLVSTRLQTHFGHIVEQIDRTMVAYDVLKMINKMTEDQSDFEYYQLLLRTLSYLDAPDSSIELARAWFMVQLLKIHGYAINTDSTESGATLRADGHYNFDYQEMSFSEQARGTYGANHIKMLRLLSDEEPQRLQVISGIDVILPAITQLSQRVIATHN